MYVMRCNICSVLVDNVWFGMEAGCVCHVYSM